MYVKYIYFKMIFVWQLVMGFPAVAFLQTCFSYFPCVYLLICGPGKGHIFRAKLCLLFSLLEDSAVANIVDKQGEH